MYGVSDMFLGEDGLLVLVMVIDCDFVEMLVYNLEVDGEFMYFVGGVWVYNMSC